MNCPICNAGITLKMNRCGQCGQELKAYGKVIRISNAYYNIGLEQAKVRDLSGAVHSLKKSLKLYKYNSNARNLLALVYYEMGEVVSALSEWVVSNHLQPEGNDATNYIDMVQSNPSKLEVINQTIRKYNAALMYAKQGNEDLAIIQLKKVTSLNPKFVRAGQLLALLYMRAGERGKAMRCLIQAKKVDVNNTRTLKYMEELQGTKTEMLAASDEGKRSPKIFHGEPVSSIMPVDSYKEEKPRVLPFVNVLLGLILGLLVSVFLIKPQIEKQKEKEYSNQIKENGEQLASRDSQIAGLENTVRSLQERVDEYEKNKTEDDGKESDAGLTESLNNYESLFKSTKLYMEEKSTEAAVALLDVKEELLGAKTAKQTYKTIKEATFEKASTELGTQGRDTYNNRKYEEALPLLEQALALNPDNVDAMYFMGRLYHQQGNKEKAAEYYNRIIEDYPEHKRYSDANRKLNELGL